MHPSANAPFGDGSQGGLRSAVEPPVARTVGEKPAHETTFQSLYDLVVRI